VWWWGLAVKGQGPLRGRDGSTGPRPPGRRRRARAPAPGGRVGARGLAAGARGRSTCGGLRGAAQRSAGRPTSTLGGEGGLWTRRQLRSLSLGAGAAAEGAGRGAA
jgi:hypothetical protein